ncbi:efflux RND transporter periplasmic adaptor subunit [Desulfothermus sp.]
MKKIVFFLIPIAFILFGCFKEENISNKSNLKTIKGIKISKIVPIKMREEIKLSGSVIPCEGAKIFSKVIGEVKDIKIKEGSFVKKDDLLIDIDDRLYKSKLRQARAAVLEIKKHIKAAEKKLNAAKANYILAKKTYKRFKKLKQKEVVSKQRFDEVLANFQSAKSMYLAANAELEALLEKLKISQAKVDEAKTYLGYTKIRAPFAGVVIKKFVDIGDSVAPSSPLIEVQLGNRYQIRCEVPESYVNFVKLNQRLKAKMLNKTVVAKVSTIVPLGNEMSRSYEVKLDIPLLDFIKPGMFASVFIKTFEKNFIFIPKSSLVSHGQIQGLYVVDKKGKINFRIIRTGRIIDNKVEIISGVLPGEKYIEYPNPSIEDGAVILAVGGRDE